MMLRNKKKNKKNDDPSIISSDVDDIKSDQTGEAMIHAYNKGVTEKYESARPFSTFTPE